MKNISTIAMIIMSLAICAVFALQQVFLESAPIENITTYGNESDIREFYIDRLDGSRVIIECKTNNRLVECYDGFSITESKQ